MCEGVYCILLFNKEIYVADYNGAYGLIGGRIEEGETPPGAMLRELEEETKLEVDNVLRIKDTGERQAFKSKRCTHPKKMEIHYMYVLEVNKKPENGDIKVAKISKSVLLESTPYPNAKEALKRILQREEI